MATKKNFTKTAAEIFISSAAEEQKEVEPKKEVAPKKAKTKKQTDPAKYDVPQGYKLVPENKTARVQLLVKPSTKEGMKIAAAMQGTTLNDLANKVFEDYLKERK